MFINFRNILLSIKFHVPHWCCVNRQKLLNIFNPTSLFLYLNYKKNHQMTLSGLFIGKNNKNNLLGLTNTLSGILELKQLTFSALKILGFYWNKKWKFDDFDVHFLTRSSKIPKGVFIYYVRSIFCLSNSFYPFTCDSLELHFF